MADDVTAPLDAPENPILDISRTVDEDGKEIPAPAGSEAVTETAPIASPVSSDESALGNSPNEDKPVGNGMNLASSGEPKDDELGKLSDAPTAATESLHSDSGGILGVVTASSKSSPHEDDSEEEAPKDEDPSETDTPSTPTEAPSDGSVAEASPETDGEGNIPSMIGGDVPDDVSDDAPTAISGDLAVDTTTEAPADTDVGAHHDATPLPDLESDIVKSGGVEAGPTTPADAPSDSLPAPIAEAPVDVPANTAAPVASAVSADAPLDATASPAPSSEVGDDEQEEEASEPEKETPKLADLWPDVGSFADATGSEVVDGFKASGDALYKAMTAISEKYASKLSELQGETSARVFNLRDKAAQYLAALEGMFSRK